MFLLTTAVGYGIAAVLLILLLVLVPFQSLLGNQRVLDPLLKLICRLLPLGFGCRVQVTGRQHIDRGKSYIFMSNHVNILDAPVLYGHIPNFVRAVELEDHFSWPVWGTITRRLGNIPISHKNMTQAMGSLRRAAEALAGGTSIIILPEGHRTRDGNLGPFMRGPFRLALSSRADIVPVAMRGAYDRKNVHSPIVHPGRMELVFGTPIPFQSYGAQTDRELRAAVRRAIGELIGPPGR